MPEQDLASRLGAWLATPQGERVLTVWVPAAALVLVVAEVLGVVSTGPLIGGLLGALVVLLLLGALVDELRRPRVPTAVDGAPPDGPPPVPWIAQHVWRTSREWTRFRGLYGPGSEDDRLLDVAATTVPADVHDRAPRITRPGDDIPTGTLAEHQERLDATPRVGAWWNPAPWPVCCGRLARIVLANPTGVELSTWERDAGPLDDAVLTPEHRESWASELSGLRDGGCVENGVNVFHCSACGALYGVYSHT